jgi:glycosyltransferase involved in cell wall biosynthesis
MKRILYFGLFDPTFSRNKVYLDGLRQNGYTVHICTDSAPRFKKYWNLFWKHWSLRKEYDVMIVGYPGYVIVPFAKLITRRPVILDALCSFHETIILSRDAYRGVPGRSLYVWLVDWCATRCADTILVESNHQRDHFEEVLGVSKAKLVTVYTGVDDEVFRYDPTAKKCSRFTVLFRGRITREAGVETVVRSAKLLEHEDIDVLIIGYGWNAEMASFRAVLDELSPKNVTHVGTVLQSNEMVSLMQSCHVSLGQFSLSERLDRTIPHKAFESMALQLPYITAQSKGVSEILTDGVSCLTVPPEDPEALAQAIRTLKQDASKAHELAHSAYQVYLERFRPATVVAPVCAIVSCK